jgi:lysophospholipase L1-like esterase
MHHMHQVLVYGDSLSWGIVPETRVRLPFDQRWPGVLEDRLNASGERVRVIEDCLNGRRTVWEDPFKAGRNGLDGLAQCMEVNSPLSLVILMLGTNDFQFCHPHNNAWSAAQGVARLVDVIRKAPIEPGMAVSPILIVCPPQAKAACGTMAEKFDGAEQRSEGLAEAYAQMASDLGCHFFDAGAVVSVSKLDGVHLDADQHPKLADALVEVVRRILNA